MGANLSKVFVVDVESTCWETDEERGDQPMELIEIGICELLLKSRTILNKRSYLVKPRYTKVSPFCTKLTGWTQAAIDQGSDITIALTNIKLDYGISRHHVWFSFGEFDRYKLSSVTEGGVGDLYGIEPKDNPFDIMRAHFNVKTLMALKENLNRELGMARALKFYGLELEGRHHNGADDAYNTAKIVDRVMS